MSHLFRSQHVPFRETRYFGRQSGPCPDQRKSLVWGPVNEAIHIQFNEPSLSRGGRLRHVLSTVSKAVLHSSVNKPNVHTVTWWLIITRPCRSEGNSHKRPCKRLSGDLPHHQHVNSPQRLYVQALYVQNWRGGEKSSRNWSSPAAHRD